MGIWEFEGMMEAEGNLEGKEGFEGEEFRFVKGLSDSYS